jgi:hypothetical protein
VRGSGASFSASGRPPSTTASLHTSFFMPSAGRTQGPPVSLQPGDAAMPNSSCLSSASPAANRNASAHSGLM